MTDNEDTELVPGLMREGKHLDIVRTDQIKFPVDPAIAPNPWSPAELAAELQRRTFHLVSYLSANGFFVPKVADDPDMRNHLWEIFSKEYERATNLGMHIAELKKVK